MSDKVILQVEDGEAIEVSERNERTVRAAVDVAIQSERARCADVARKAWMHPDLLRWLTPGDAERVAELIEAGP